MTCAQVPTAERSGLVWRLVEKLDEQRLYPRVPVDVRAALRKDNGQKCAARVTNISPDGLQLRCAVEAAEVLHPQGGRLDPVTAPFVNVAAAIPINGHETRTIVARCQLFYLTTVDYEPRCVVGVRFTNLDLQSQRILHAFFADQLILDGAGAI